MGRKSKYTPDVVKRITDAIQVGATYELACKYAGITRETFYQWINHKPDFSDAVNSAEGQAATRWLGYIEKAAQENTWQAAAWKLERRYPQQYGKTVQEWQGKVEVDYANHILSDLDSEVMAILDRGRARAAKRGATGEEA
jgi:hypothetical protein